MILTRLGNKRRIAHKIYPHFPQHSLYVELFFGAGGMFFSKPRAKHNILNDLDSDVYNLFQVVSDRAAELEAYWRTVPVHDELFQYWRKNKETDPIRKAARFLLLSNFGYMGKPDTLHFSSRNTASITASYIPMTQEAIFGTKLMNTDFENAVVKLKKSDAPKTFVYCDPPYLGTSNNYENGGFTPQDTERLFRVMVESGLRFAISEFDHPKVLELAGDYGLNVIEIGERVSLKKRSMELLFTNYAPVQAASPALSFTHTHP